MNLHQDDINIFNGIIFDYGSVLKGETENDWCA